MRLRVTLGKSPLTSLDDFGPMMESVTNSVADALRANAPKDTGLLADTLGDSVREIGKNKWVVGGYSDLGSRPSDISPKGTIASFLKDYPEFKAAKGVQYWHAPWWYLPSAGKRKLREERMVGKYGGVAGKPPYWHVVDAGSGRPAYVKARGYVDKTTAQVDAIVRQAVRDFMGF